MKIHNDIDSLKFPRGYYPNIWNIGKRGSGKTTATFAQLKKIVAEYKPREVAVIIFAGQLYTDKSYEKIVRWLKRKHIDYVLETSFKDKSGENQLSTLVSTIAKSTHSVWSELDPFYDQAPEDSEESDSEETKARWQELEEHKPEVLIMIIDDMSAELPNNKNLKSLMKENRHMKIITIINSQDAKDLQPTAIAQMQVATMFPKIPSDRLKHLYHGFGISGEIPDFNDFLDIYHELTGEREDKKSNHSFMVLEI